MTTPAEATVSPNSDISFINPSILPQPLPLLTESPYLYRSLGYHPIYPGDLLANNRFLVLNKLGHGHNSTVWLCLDHKAHRRPYKAIRVFHVRASRLHHGDEVFFIWQKKDVLGISEKIAYEKLCLAIPLDEFHVKDEKGDKNGSRGTLVYPVLGPQVDNEGYLGYLAEKTGKSVWEVKRRVCYMVADALESMHGLGLCHGDLRPENMLFEVRGLERLDLGEVKKVFGGPPRGYRHGLPLVVDEGGATGVRPEYLVLKAELDYRLLDEILAGKPAPKRKHVLKHDTDHDDDGIPKAYLIDMGAAWRFNELDPEPWYPLKSFYDRGISPGGIFHRDFVQDRREILSREYTAPEVWFGLQDPGPESEIWALGCTIVKIILGKVPFGDGKEPVKWDPQGRLTYESLKSVPDPMENKWAMMKDWEDFCGPLPDSYKDRLKKESAPGFHAVVPLEDIRGCQEIDTIEREVRNQDIARNDASKLIHLLRGIFAWDSTQRLRATEVLDHPWFQVGNGRC